MPMKPTEKSPEIDALITELAGGTSRQEALAADICVWCKKPITEFRDPLSRKEYRITGMCQSCQDKTFGG